jgi:hypothetical protein
MRTVSAGRNRLQSVSLVAEDETDAQSVVAAGFFDQDRG